MSTESPRQLADLATHPAAPAIAAGIRKQVAARAGVEVRYVRAEDAAARKIASSTATEAHPYSSFEEGGVRRFDRPAFAYGPFCAPAAELPRFRIS